MQRAGLSHGGCGSSSLRECIELLNSISHKSPATCYSGAKTDNEAAPPQTSTVQDESPPQKGNGGSAHQDASGFRVHLVENRDLREMVPLHLIGPLETVPQHLVRVEILMVCRVLQRPRLASQQRVHQLNRLMQQYGDSFSEDRVTFSTKEIEEARTRGAPQTLRFGGRNEPLKTQRKRSVDLSNLMVHNPSQRHARLH